MNWVFFAFYCDDFVGSVVSVIIVALLMKILYCFTVIGNSKWTRYPCICLILWVARASAIWLIFVSSLYFQDLRDRCLNGGTCRDGYNDKKTTYTCSCPKEWKGKRCEERFDACHPDPCKNGAWCHRGKTQFDFECTCLDGWGGKLCAIRVKGGL